MKNGFILIFPNEKIMNWFRPTSNIHFEVQYSRFKDIAVYLVGLKRCCVLWTAKSERNCHRWSLSIIIIQIEASIRPKTPIASKRRKVIFLYDNARSHIAFISEANAIRAGMRSHIASVFFKHCSIWFSLVPVDATCSTGYTS